MRGVVASGVAVAAVAAFLVAGPAGAADTDPRIDLRVLVVTDGTPGVDAVSAQLEREGVPFDSADKPLADVPLKNRLISAASHDEDAVDLQAQLPSELNLASIPSIGRRVGSN